MSKCGCSLSQLKREYSLEDAMQIWEANAVMMLNESEYYKKKMAEMNARGKIPGLVRHG